MQYKRIRAKYIPCLLEQPEGIECHPYEQFKRQMNSITAHLYTVETKVNLNDKDNPIKYRFDITPLKLG